MKVSKELKDEIGNALAAYGKILFNAYVGAKLPSDFDKLRYCSYDELDYKITILKEFYDSLETE